MARAAVSPVRVLVWSWCPPSPYLPPPPSPCPRVRAQSRIKERTSVPQSVLDLTSLRVLCAAHCTPVTYCTLHTSISAPRPPSLVPHFRLYECPAFAQPAGWAIGRPGQPGHVVFKLSPPLSLFTCCLQTCSRSRCIPRRVGCSCMRSYIIPPACIPSAVSPHPCLLSSSVPPSLPPSFLSFLLSFL